MSFITEGEQEAHVISPNFVWLMGTLWIEHVTHSMVMIPKSEHKFFHQLLLFQELLLCTEFYTSFKWQF